MGRKKNKDKKQQNGGQAAALEPPKPGPKPSCWKDPRIALLGFSILLFVVFLYWFLKPKWDEAATLDAAFVQGRQTMVAAPIGVSLPRSELHDQLCKLLRPPVTNKYLTVVGLSAAGKTTALHKASREIFEDGVNGVIFFSVDTAAGFVQNLAKLVGFLPYDLEMSRFSFSDFFSVNVKKVEGPALWDGLRSALLEAADMFMSKFHRPATLVIDDVQKILRSDPNLFNSLHDFAKSAADSHTLRVVLVSSEFSVYTYMMRHSASSRGQVFQFPQVPTDDAIRFLKEVFNWTSPEQAATAEYIVTHITGGVLGLLQQVEADWGISGAAKEILLGKHRQYGSLLDNMGLVPGHAIYQRLGGSELFEDALLRRHSNVTAETIDKLVDFDLLFPHCTNGTWSFAAPWVSSMFFARRAAD